MEINNASSIKNSIDDAIHVIEFWNHEKKPYPEDLKKVLKLLRDAKKIVEKYT